MIPIIVASVLLMACVMALFVVARVARAVADQFEELMPQRMIDFSGFVDAGMPHD